MQSAYKREVTNQLQILLFVTKWLGCQFATILVIRAAFFVFYGQIHLQMYSSIAGLHARYTHHTELFIST